MKPDHVTKEGSRSRACLKLSFFIIQKHNELECTTAGEGESAVAVTALQQTTIFCLCDFRKKGL